ncbi:DUF2345 domain-containing protein [Caldimonas caldifontis]|uniref:DUF2345 domain-containing protein n=1 Tax=Caldimonas caldifontis TaxID=1452508 RepID=UPI001B80198F|nr:DUF2345 domain-containing protein [Caldimonas caldifontis]
MTKATKAIEPAAGPLSLRAHTDTLSLHADRDATITSTHDEIHVQASTRIELTSGASRIVLDGANITFTCPGTFTVQAATHEWTGAPTSPSPARAPSPSRRPRMSGRGGAARRRS